MPRKLPKAVAKNHEAVEGLRQEFPRRPFTPALRSGRCISLEPSIRKSYAFENTMTVRDRHSSARCPIRCMSGGGSKMGERRGGRNSGVYWPGARQLPIEYTTCPAQPHK
jgi:hypothetical protein